MRRGPLARAAARLADVAALLGFVRRRRSLLLAVLVAVLLAVAAVLYAAQTAAVAPYLYPLF